MAHRTARQRPGVRWQNPERVATPLPPERVMGEVRSTPVTRARLAFSSSGGIYQIFSEVMKKLIKSTEKPLSVPVGTRAKIR